MGNRLKMLREARGLTQEALGELIGMTHTAIQRLESGNRGLTEERVWQLAKALDVHPGELFAPLPATGLDDPIEARAARVARRLAHRERDIWMTMGAALMKEKASRGKVPSE